MTDEEMAFYRKRQLELHEERARERQLYAELNLLRVKQAGEALRRLKGD